MSNLATLKKLATCLGCCKDTKDNPAKSNDEAIEFICEHIGSVANSGVTDITLNVGSNGKLVSGTWEDTAGNSHDINIQQEVNDNG